jgi:orotidine-5'-phosphate decarboxylase
MVGDVIGLGAKISPDRPNLPRISPAGALPGGLSGSSRSPAFSAPRSRRAGPRPSASPGVGAARRQGPASWDPGAGFCRSAEWLDVGRPGTVAARAGRLDDNRGVADSFASRYAAVRSVKGPLAWGLDPSGALLDSWGLGDTPDGLDRFADIALRAAVGTVGLVKLQSAFYERHGWRGFRTLQRLIAEARSAGLLVIVDAKRGDVGTTNAAYAEAFLGEDAPLAADALTVHPYLGLAAMGAFVTRACEAGSCLLVVTRSSNPEGRDVQSALDGSGRSVEEALLCGIGELNDRLTPGGIGPIGAVIGPTHMDPALDLLAANGLFLAPGVGVQGATSEDVARVFESCPERVMPSASRSLLSDGPDVSRLRETAAMLASDFRVALAGLPPRSVPSARAIVTPH